ncbi:MAG: hypothetical protein Q9170_006018 [Blastenia crenularia]
MELVMQVEKILELRSKFRVRDLPKEAQKTHWINILLYDRLEILRDAEPSQCLTTGLDALDRMLTVRQLFRQERLKLAYEDISTACSKQEAKLIEEAQFAVARMNAPVAGTAIELPRSGASTDSPVEASPVVQPENLKAETVSSDRRFEISAYRTKNMKDPGGCLPCLYLSWNEKNQEYDLLKHSINLSQKFLDLRIVPKNISALSRSEGSPEMLIESVDKKSPSTSLYVRMGSIEVADALTSHIKERAGGNYTFNNFDSEMFNHLAAQYT